MTLFHFSHTLAEMKMINGEQIAVQLLDAIAISEIEVELKAAGLLESGLYFYATCTI